MMTKNAAWTLLICPASQTDILFIRTTHVRLFDNQTHFNMGPRYGDSYKGGDRFRPDGCGGGGMCRTLTWPAKSREQTSTANNSDVSGRVGFGAPLAMAA